jgi:uncharacterized protein
MTDLPLSRPVEVRRLPSDGLVVDVVANAEERSALARDLDIPAVDRLEARLTVTPARGGARVRGHVSATVVQTCVVSLEPFEAPVEEDVDIRFSRSLRAAPAAEIDLTAQGDDAPEPLEGDVIDVGAVVAEHLALGLDPYPRKPDARFEDIVEPLEEAPARSPFADLSGLLRKP